MDVTENSQRKIIFALGIILFLAVNISTLKDGHNWGDDFAQYIINARNIAEHKPYNEGVMLDNPAITPPGYPILLAPLIKFFGVNFKILKSINIPFWLLFVWLTYQFCFRYLEKETALLVSLAFLSSSCFFTLKQNVISDIPFLTFSNCAVYFFLKYEDYKKETIKRSEFIYFALFLLFSFFSVFVRTVGYFLFAAAIFYLSLIRRDLKAAAWTCLALTATITAQIFTMGLHPGQFSELSQTPAKTLLISILQNFSLPFRSVVMMLLTPQNLFSFKVFVFIDKIVSAISPVILAGILVMFVRRLTARTISFPEVFTVLYLFGLIYWTCIFQTLTVFARYIFPIEVFFMIFCIKFFSAIMDKYLKSKGAEAIRRAIIRGALAFLIFVNITNIASNFRFNDDVIYHDGRQELFAWVREHIAPNEYFMFQRPRFLALMTGRVGTMPFRYGADVKNLRQRIKNLNIVYWILNKYDPDDLYIMKVLYANPDFAESAWENQYFKIFKIKAQN